jgi:hypothetical protein
VGVLTASTPFDGSTGRLASFRVLWRGEQVRIMQLSGYFCVLVLGVRIPLAPPCDEGHGLHMSRVIGYKSPRPAAGVLLLIAPVISVWVDVVARDEVVVIRMTTGVCA